VNKTWTYKLHELTFYIKTSGDRYVLLYDDNAFLMHGETPDGLLEALLFGNVPDIICKNSAIIHDTSTLNVPDSLDKWELTIT